MAGNAIDSLLKEERLFAPPTAFAREAHVPNHEAYRTLWERSVKDPEGFWAEQAAKYLQWDKKWEKILDWKVPHAQWFVGGKLNASVNCLDKNIAAGLGKKTALIWEGEPGDKREISYEELHKDVCRTAHTLAGFGLKKGDRVTIYMPLIPELVVAVLACTRLGLVHSVVFGGFSAEALADRNNDAAAKALITADGGWRRGHVIPLKPQVDLALAKSPTVKHVLVYRRTGQDIYMEPGRDVWWHDAVAQAADTYPPVSCDSEDPMFILYTSGSTGKPKGIVHTTAGYLLGAALSSHQVFDLKSSDRYWCTADVGWITGHSYVVYGPLINGATLVMYEGAINWPDAGRLWQMIERYRVSILYTAPTAIRALMSAGEQWPGQYNLTSLRLLGTVGEPINPEAWMWYHRVIGGERCPIVDTWWQTETGSIMISPLPGATSTTPGCATLPFFGVDAAVVDKDGKPVPEGQGGFLVIRKPWPSMLRTIFNDDERYQKQYWSQIPGMYFTGDGARRDGRGYFWVMGRIDDVLNVSGHRLSTMEIESALVSHPLVAEAAVVGKPDAIKGEAVVCFVTLKKGASQDNLSTELQKHVAKHIGALARPDEVRFAEALPKTRSGKIMRRLLRDIAAGRETQGDKSTLEDLSVLAQLREEA